MNTAVIMKRELFGMPISQNSKTEYYSATELFRAGNKWRINNNMQILNMNDWFNLQSTKLFVEELEKKYGNVKISGRGRGNHTWVHPYLFLDMALALNPKLKIEVYQWLYDNLIEYRNNSGDSYKKMCGALYLTQSNKSEFAKDIVKIANIIKISCNVTNWQEATEKQLKLRDKIHEYIALFSDIIRERNNLIEIAIKKAKEEVK